MPVCAARCQQLARAQVSRGLQVCGDCEGEREGLYVRVQAQARTGQTHQSQTRQPQRQMLGVCLSETAGETRVRKILEDPHLLETISDSQTTYTTAVEETESDVSAENLNAGSWERNHFTAAQRGNHGHSCWSGVDLKYRRQKEASVHRLLLHVAPACVCVQR